MASEGSSNVERAGEILVHLGNAGTEGLALQAIAAQLGDAKSATRRALVALSIRGFVEATAKRGHYRLGPAIYGLANRPSSVNDLVARFRPAVMAVAARTGHSTYLMTRAGFEAICIDMHEGNAVIRTLSGGVGGRIPLGIGPGSLCILSALDDATRATVIEHNADRYAERATDARGVKSLVEITRRQGFSHDISQAYPEAAGVACLIERPGLGAIAALSIAMPSAQMTDDIPSEIARIMHEEVSRC
jgi:DNA-binding IclR family transcriptional regulator